MNSLLSKGEIPDVSFSIGTNIKDVFSKFGKPDESMYFLGGKCFTYKNTVLFTDSTNDDGNVTLIGFSKDTNLYGSKVGMLPEQINNILGNPSHEEESGINNELFNVDRLFIYCLLYTSRCV